ARCCDGVMIDISDRKAIERQLRFTQYGLDHAADCFYCLDEEARIVQVNQATCQRTGYTKEQLLNMTIHELAPTCPKETTWKPHWEKLKRLKSYSFESVQQTRMGEIFPVEVVCNYLEFEGKAYDFELVRDITARKQAEAALHLSEARATATFNQAPVGFAEVALSTNNQLSRVNPYFCQMMGYTHAELVGMTVQEITHPDDIPLSQEPSKRLSRGELSSFTLEKRYRRKDGTDFWAETTVYLIRQQNGEALCEVAFIQDISEKKRLEFQRQQAVEALQLSEVRANATFAQAVVGIAESNLIDGKIIRPNNCFCQMLGYTERELGALTVADITHPEDVSDSLNQAQRLFSREIDSFIIEKRYIRKDKSYFWASTTVSLIQTSAEEVPRCLAVVQDISDRKAAEQKLLESQTFLQTVLDTFPLSVFWKDRDSRYIGVNQNFAQDAGFQNSEDIAGLTDSDMPWAESEGHLYQADDQAVMLSDSPKIGILETQIQADGTQVWIETNKLPLHDLDGNVIGVMGTYQDISDRKQAEMALEKEALRRTAVFNASPDGIHVLDQAGNVLETNEGFAQMLGYSLDEVSRLNVTDWDAQWSAEEIQDILQEIFQNYTPGPQETFDTLHRRKDGSVFPVEVSACPMEWNGEFSIVCISRDISERKQAESELKRTNQELARATRLKDEFLANMSHELRTPLNAILGMTEGLQDQVFGEINAQQRKALTTIEHSGSHLLELINEILDLAKIEAGNIELAYASVSVTHLCQSSLTFIRQQSLTKGVQLHLEMPWDLPPIRVDERRTRQVLINLLNNAVKFTPSGGSVTLKVAQPQSDDACDQQYLRFTVTDTGIG
ncbi:MAG: PAS domain S-box protein, partial [Cyanobacteria bacterium P01_F01_bin.3]